MILFQSIVLAVAIPAFLISDAAAQNCASANTCVTCTGISGCGWCPNTWQCLPGNAQGPTGSVCTSYIYGSGGCAACSTLSTCVDCLGEEECGWQVSQGKCAYSDSTTTTSATCPCNLLSQCTDCLSFSCVYCASTATCVSPSSIPQNCGSAAECDCSLWNGNCSACTAQTDICAYCSASGTCDTLLTSSCGSLLTNCPSSPLAQVAQSFNGASFGGGIALGAIVVGIPVLIVYLVWRRRNLQPPQV